MSIQVTDVLRPKEDKFRDSKYATGRGSRVYYAYSGLSTPMNLVSPGCVGLLAESSSVNPRPK